MCLGVPARIIDIEPDGLYAIAVIRGVQARISLALVEACAPGAYVLVHAGHAIQVVDEAEARARLALWEELARSGSLV